MSTKPFNMKDSDKTDKNHKSTLDFINNLESQRLPKEVPAAKPMVTSPMFKVLWLDDSKSVLAHYKDVFHRHSLQELYALNIREAMTQISQNPDIKIIFVDLMLSAGESGFQFISMLRAQKIMESAKIFVVSGTIDRKSVLEAKKLGVEEILSKPVPEETLLDRIKKYHPVVQVSS